MMRSCWLPPPTTIVHCTRGSPRARIVGNSRLSGRGLLSRSSSLSTRSWVRAAGSATSSRTSSSIEQRKKSNDSSSAAASRWKTSVVAQRREIHVASALSLLSLPSLPSLSPLASLPKRRLRSALPDDDDCYRQQHEDSIASTTSSISTTPTKEAPSASKTSPTPFLLADIGEGIAEVELLRWFVAEGQEIREFDPVCEVQSDKATVEITSRYEGKVHKLAHENAGNMIKVGEPILWILEEHEQEQRDGRDHDAPRAHNEEAPPAPLSSPPRHHPTNGLLNGDGVHRKSSSVSDNSSFAVPDFTTNKAAEATATAAAAAAATAPNQKVLTSPAVRKLARDHRLDLCTVAGTGPAGRISKGDVLAILKEKSMKTEGDSFSATGTVELGDRSVSATTSTANNEIYGPSSTNDATHHHHGHLLLEDTVVPLRGYNRIMADTMTASLKIPHMVYSDEINLNRFVRYKLEQQQQEQPGDHLRNKLVFLPFAIKAASKALEEYPWLNASFNDAKHEVTLWKDHNIGIAMDTPRGLIVPVIKECQRKSLPELADELQRLKDAVSSAGGGGLPGSDLRGATFTLSNVGALGTGGGTYMSPIITPPQVAIGALGRVRRLPRFAAPSRTDPSDSQRVEEAHVCEVSWAADHRVVDGATVARFQKRFKEYMENPLRLLLELR